MSLLRRGFHVAELEEWLPPRVTRRGAATWRPRTTVRRLLARGDGRRPAQRRWYDHFNVTFDDVQARRLPQRPHPSPAAPT